MAAKHRENNHVGLSENEISYARHCLLLAYGGNSCARINKCQRKMAAKM